MSRLPHPFLTLVLAVCLVVLAPAATAMPAPDRRDGPALHVARASSAGGAGATPGQPWGTWPLRPRPAVASYFEPPEARWGAGHRGVDLRGHIGQQVRTALPGRVSFAGRIAGMPVVVVDHGDTRTTYQPVAATVGRGDQVTAGQVIGRLTWSGTHCSPAACLHWGWIRGDTYLDPLRLVGAAPRPVRLLPL
jgi:murein DD-endopeptidase MepM/ murein hydrolase activator NlpD